MGIHMNRWVDVAYRQACKKIAREKSERATFCIASITHNGVNSFLKSFSYFQATFFNEKPVFFSLQNMYREEKEVGRVQRYESK